ncbi:MAG TPA: nitroreductase family deazaflavin-dependent oxidoreductase [Dehalococcoidia bacterium]|nr:nitroreductase family deazaflavin-dependent oxidoreductase [Dehalococcoidia bacterium]
MASVSRSGWIHTPPSGLLRRALQLPALLYRVHLGRLLGHRFLLLTHRGRRSGRVRHTVLEVVRYDRRSRVCIVTAGWGARAGWYRNLQAHPALAITIGREHYLPKQRFLTDAEVRATLIEYQRRHRLAARVAARLLGTPIAQATPLPMVAFRPPTK